MTKDEYEGVLYTTCKVLGICIVGSGENLFCQNRVIFPSGHLGLSLMFFSFGIELSFLSLFPVSTKRFNSKTEFMIFIYFFFLFIFFHFFSPKAKGK